ncbi:MAG TPA: Spy/CpxP family protein refolding chaperone [Pyrinomonadaceae bacterium]|nr:Spy/CpxP family protein refolding chaperone [Pyrinomonadaceae bacterium]
MLKFALLAPALLALFSAAGVRAVARAQDGNAAAPTPGAQRELDTRRRGANAPGLLRILNLTPEQRAQISAIRRETEPQGRLLGARLRAARRALDEAIYSANPGESFIEERVRELGAAQTAVVRLRSLTELRIRRLLTPEQLDAFRRLQRRPRAPRERTDQLPAQPGGLPGDAPARFIDGRRRRRLEQQRQRRQPLLNEQNAPAPPAPRERRPDPSRDLKP